MPYISVEEEVWVDLDSFETEDLIEELKKRKAHIEDIDSVTVNEIYMAKHVRKQPYDHLVDRLINETLGKVV